MDDLSSYIILPINTHLLPNIVSGPHIANESDIASTNDKVYTNIEYYISPTTGIENVYVNTTNSSEMQSGHFISKGFVDITETTNDIIYKCTSCEAKYNKYEHYLDHLQSHENKTFFQCKTCKKTFDKMSAYHNHIMNHQEDKLFTCSLCHNGFNFENNFKIHMALHGNSLVCPICDLSFQRMASLKSHLAIHQVEELHICSECSSEFENVADLRKHIKTHTLDIIDHQNDLTCNICKVKFETPILLKHHIASHIKVKKLVLNGKRNKTQIGNKEHKHKCAICSKTFPKFSLLERHIRIHSGERPYVCTICDKGFTQKGTLQIHMTKHSGIKPFCCTLCPAKFNQKGNLKVHVQKTHTATTEDEKIFKCSQCDCIFKKVASLNGHMTKIHATDTAEISIASIIDQPKNNKRLVGNSDLPNSIIPQSTDNKLEVDVADELPQSDKISKIYSLKQKFLGTSKVYICSYCDKEIKKPSDLIRHLRTHTKERPFKCFCGNSFSIKSTLLTHMQIHKGNIGKKCSKCSKVLFSQKAWNAHLRKHDTSLQTSILKSHNHRNFHGTKEQLNESEKSSNESSVSFLKKVKRTQLHPGERKYKCRVCHRSFGTPFSIKEHMKLHNEARKFECGTCDKTFFSKPLLKRHMSIHNTSKPYECFYCRKKFKNMLMCGRHIRTHENNGDNVKQDILRASICYVEDTVPTHQTTPNVSESTSLLEVNPNEILDNLFDSDPQKITVESDNVDFTENVEKFTPSSTSNTLEFERNEDLQTFFVDCSTDDHEEDGLPNNFFSHLDLQPSNIIDLDCVNEMQQSPIVFNVQNIISEGALPAVDMMNSELYINDTSGPTESQKPKSLLKNVQKATTSALSNLICIPNDISDNFLANNISLYPNTRIGFDKSSELNSTIPSNVITSQEDIFLKETENAENNTAEGLNVISVSFKESGGGTGNLNIIHCSACKRLFENMESYESHSCFKSVLKKNHFNESVDSESTKPAVDNQDNKKSSKPESISQKPAKKNFRCVYCGKEFNSRGAYIRHANTHHKNFDGMHKCKFCIKKFKKPSDLSRHLRTHTGEKPFACDKCDKKFSLKSTLEGHYRTHNPGATKDFVCEVCNSFFTSKSSLKIHMHVHTGIKPHKCNYCDQHFRTLAHRRSHEHKIHSNCSITNSQSKFKPSIDPSKLKTIVEEGQKSELREISESTEIKMQFSDQGNQTLTDAIQIDDVLLQQLQNSNIIIEVLQDIDPKEQSSLITIDENTLENLEIMTGTNTQSNEHTNDESIEIESERNIECDICHKKYASKDVFRKHMQLHLKNKFICELCNKWFSTVEALCEHEKLHSGHRPYSCFLCTNNFAELQHMKSHLKRIHQIEDTNSPLILKMSIGGTDI